MEDFVKCNRMIMVVFMNAFYIWLTFDISFHSEAVPVACLNSCLHANARGPSNTFYKVAGHIGMYGLMVGRK